jgi:hypothetical protein
LFKTFHGWPADESCRLQGFLENGHQFLFKLNMRNDEIKQWDFAVFAHL